MKKLMIAMAAMTAGVAMADVTSANIVGYAGNNLVNGFKAIAPSFVNIAEKDGVKGFYLTQVTPSGADKHTSTENLLQLQILDPSGVASANYVYHKGDTTRAYKNFDGWYYGTTAIKPENDVFFPVGTGFWVSGTEALTITTSGEVVQDSLQCDLVDGFRLVANPFPVVTKLTNVIPSGAEKHTSTENLLQLQILDPSGVASANYVYHKGDTTRAYKNYDGWYYGTTAIKPENDVEIPAGASVWVSGNTSLKLTVVTPFEDAE